VKGRSQNQNVKVIIEDVSVTATRMHVARPAEATWGQIVKAARRLMFTKAEIEELNHLAHEVAKRR